jgi:hypothetical protein
MEVSEMLDGVVQLVEDFLNAVIGALNALLAALGLGVSAIPAIEL